MVQRTYMPSFRVQTSQRAYDAIVERGALSRVAEFLPPGAGMVFVVTTADVFKLHGETLLGSFHRPLAVLIDPDVVRTLPEREYRAGLYEIVKCGVIRDPELFGIMDQCAPAVLAQKPATVERIIAAAVRIKAEVVTA